MTRSIAHPARNGSPHRRSGRSRGHEQQLAVLVVAIGSREIPDGALRLVVLATAENAGAGVLVGVLFGPLPDVAHHVHHAVGARAFGMGVDGIGTGHGAAGNGPGHVRGLPVISPGIGATIGALRGELPLPLVRQALACPLCVGARIFKGTQVTGRLSQPSGKVPFFQSRRKLMRRGGRNAWRRGTVLNCALVTGILVDEERRDLHLVLVESARCILPWILHIDAGVSVAFDLGALNAEDEIAAGNSDHACRGFGGGCCGRDGDEGLGQDGVLVREGCERLLVIAAMRCMRDLMASDGSPGVARMAPYALASRSKLKYGGLRLDVGFQLDSVIEVEVAHARGERHTESDVR